MAGLGGLFGEGSIASQFLLWGVAYGIAEAVLAPVLTYIEQDAFEALPIKTPSPADLADWVVRTIVPESTAQAEATRSGVSADWFDAMVKGAGEPPGLDFMMQAYRRGYIPLGPTEVGTPSLLEGVATSRVYTYWSDVIQSMLDVPLSPADAVEATIRGQIPASQGQSEAYASGVSAERFQILVDTAGNPPALGELIELVRRGIIPNSGTGPQVLSFQQGIYEGDNKDKWLTAYEALQDAIPPVRTVTTLLSHGALTDAEAQAYFVDNGISPDLAAAEVKSATAAKLVTAKALAESNVLKLYYDQLITAAQAGPMLEQLGYSTSDTAFLLELQDFTRAAAAYNSAVVRVGNLYTARKLTRASTVKALQDLDVPAATATHLLSVWDAETAASVKSLTPSEIADAYKYAVKPIDWCLTELEAIGYTPHDAWVLCSVAAQAPAPNEPAEGSGIVGGQPVDDQ